MDCMTNFLMFGEILSDLLAVFTVPLHSQWHSFKTLNRLERIKRTHASTRSLSKTTLARRI